MYGNKLPADRLASLQPGDSVLFEVVHDGWVRTAIHDGSVARLTAKQIVVDYQGARMKLEARFSRDTGRKIGGAGRGVLLDPEHPTTVRILAEDRRERRRRRIDALAGVWARERENLDLLRELQAAIGEYLDAEDGAQ